MKHLMIGTAVGLVLAATAPAAFAQTAAEQGGRNEPTTAALDELVVTAQRREQVAQDVGIALSVVTGEQLAKQGITTVNGLQNVTPNLEVEPAFGGGQPQYRIRGVGFQDYAANNSPTVGVYVNEVAYPIPVMTQGMIFDLQRVEVLRGPQGTLYGRNTTGGAINLITGRPTADFHAGVDVEYGRFSQFKSEGFVSGPINDTLRGRLSYGIEEGGGWQYNRVTGEETGDADRMGVRAQLEWVPTSQFDARLDVHAGRDYSETVGLYLFKPFTTGAIVSGQSVTIPADTDHRATGWGLNPSFADAIGLPADSKPNKHNETWGANLNASYDFGPVKLTSITAYDQLHRRELGDWDATQYDESDVFWKGREKVFSEELRLSSNTSGALSWVGGLYYSKQRQNEIYQSDFTNVFGLAANVSYSQDVESISAFGQADYRLTDQLTLTGGLRYEHETRDLNDFRSVFGGGVALPGVDESTDMSPLTGKVELEYKPIDHVLLYASASKGVKSGGFTAYNSGNESGIAPFKPETLYAYEAGFKTNPLPNVQVNGAAYYYDYRDQQVLSVVCTANGAVGKFANAPKSKIYGAELEMIWQPIPGLRISQSGSYKEGKYREFEEVDVAACQAGQGTVLIDRAGQHIKFPKWSYQGQIGYDWNVGNYKIAAEADYSFHATYPSWLGPTYTVSDYWLANANLDVGPVNGPWTVGVYVRNLFDTEYDLTRNFFVNAQVAQAGTPRTYGVRVNVSY